jgi:hypothetical protein
MTAMNEVKQELARALVVMVPGTRPNVDVP